MQISKDKIDFNIIDEIIYKYRLDRDAFFNKNKIDKISIHQSKESSYYVVDDDYFCEDTPYMVLNLKSKDNELLDYENEFFIKFMKDMINSVDEKLHLKNNIYGGDLYDKSFMSHLSGIYIYCSRFIIRLDHKLIYKVLHLIEKHNKELEAIKSLQLKFDDYNN